jgi:hypothetical protein
VFTRCCRLALICLVLTSTACSSTAFIYNRLDFILPWYIDDYAELDREQEAYLDELLTPFLAWHRAQELPLYVKTLEQIEASLDQPATTEGLIDLSKEFERAWFRIEDNALDWLLDLGGQLSDEQMASFVEGLWEEQEKYEKKYLKRSDEEFYEDTLENFLDNASDYIGRLSPEQRQMLEKANGDLLRSDSAWLGDRADWLRQLQAMLQREPGWQLRVREAVEDRRGDSPPEFQKVYDHNLTVIRQSIVDLLNSRSEKQDRYLRGRISDLRADLEKLIDQGEKKGKGETEPRGSVEQ